MSGIPNIEEIRKKYVANFNYKRDPKDLESKSYKYYNPDNFTTKPQRIYEMKKEIEISKEFDQERKKLIMDSEKEKPKIPILNVSFTFGHATRLRLYQRKTGLCRWRMRGLHRLSRWRSS